MRIAWLKDLRLKDLEQVGGKNASLGEMIGGAFREFIAANGLGERIAQRLGALDPNDVAALAACGAEIRSWIRKAPFPESLEHKIRDYFQDLEKQTSGKTSFAVRSSATAEDLPEASFAGQQETYLNISGAD